ncbi:MAG: hypothetical protein EBZ77_05635, partial [Chitinophagia bacterium]|nr:hypothetical protein [Chitinophagia bacterium]
WKKDSIGKQFRHVTNLYADTAYYFISFNSGTGLRVQSQAGGLTPNVTSSGFNYRDVYERELVNPTTYGKTWYGETFKYNAGTTNQTITMDLGDNLSNVKLQTSLACTEGSYGSQFIVTANNSILGYPYFEAITGASVLITHSRPTFLLSSLDRIANINLQFNPSPRDPSATGYLDYILINGRRSLNITGNQLGFRDWETVGAGNVASYALQGANAYTMVWDITDPQVPVMMAGSLSGDTYTFTQEASRLHEFAVINNSSVYTPKMIGKIPNQNLHGSGQVDLIIVTYPPFKEQAEALASFHRDHDIVATTTEVYNEFSSGAPDLSAIRDFERMFYKRQAPILPKCPSTYYCMVVLLTTIRTGYRITPISYPLSRHRTTPMIFMPTWPMTFLAFSTTTKIPRTTACSIRSI